MADNLDNFSPFADPRVRKQQAMTASASFKAFNAVAGRLIADLLRLHPTDSILRFMHGELEKLSKDKQKFRTPSLVFFKEIRKPT